MPTLVTSKLAIGLQMQAACQHDNYNVYAKVMPSRVGTGFASARSMPV